jgi:hypothetical protein
MVRSCLTVAAAELANHRRAPREVPQSSGQLPFGTGAVRGTVRVHSIHSFALHYVPGITLEDENKSATI